MSLHVAFIPDGNRRWARAHAMVPWEGHAVGAKGFRPLLRCAIENGVTHLSVWCASRSNLTKRPTQEVKFLYKVLEEYFDSLHDAPEIHEHRVRVTVIGAWEEFQPPSLIASIKRIQDETRKYDDVHLTIFDAYDGITEMTDAVAAIAEAKAKDPSLVVTPDLIKSNLYTADLPPVDLAIRTGGEPHWSGGFMMWDIANSHFHFSEKLWPDFKDEDFVAALNEFKNRERRQGA